MRDFQQNKIEIAMVAIKFPNFQGLQNFHEKFFVKDSYHTNTKSKQQGKSVQDSGNQF